jgi:hypothetical protein
MTPAQIEQAARELCRMRGLDPDGSGQERWGVRPNEHDMPIWHCARGEIERFVQVGTAIAAAMQQGLPRKTRKKVVAGS